MKGVPTDDAAAPSITSSSAAETTILGNAMMPLIANTEKERKKERKGRRVAFAKCNVLLYKYTHNSASLP